MIENKKMSITRLNNRKARALRRDPIYELVMTDLYLIGAIEKQVVEALTGRKVSEHLTSPLSGVTIVDEDIDGAAI